MASSNGIWQFSRSAYLFPFPSFLGTLAALNVSMISCICTVKISPSVYLSMVSTSSRFSLRYKAFARLFAPFTAYHLILRFFMVFQLTTSHRGRLWQELTLSWRLHFQLTTSRRGRHQYFTYFMQNFDLISYIFHKNHFK